MENSNVNNYQGRHSPAHVMSTALCNQSLRMGARAHHAPGCTADAQVSFTDLILYVRL